jgi:hypothetical protein
MRVKTGFPLEERESPISGSGACVDLSSDHIAGRDRNVVAVALHPLGSGARPAPALGLIVIPRGTGILIWQTSKLGVTFFQEARKGYFSLKRA